VLSDLLSLPARSRPGKVSYVQKIEPRETVVVAELEGPGCITCINVVLFRNKNLGRTMILKIYWDGEETPSVEAPIGDFFGLGHGELYYPIDNAFFSVKNQTGYSCYFPMPFGRSARIEVENGDDPGGAYFFVDWSRYNEPLVEPMRFHAKWRREFPAPAYAEEFEILDAVGRGRFMGYSYSLCQYDMAERWSHAGAEQIYIDGHTDKPAFIRGAGGEDAFGVGYGGVIHAPESHLYSGMPLYTYVDRGKPHPFIKFNAFRFFVNEKYCFEDSLHVRFGCIGNDISSVGYWYQSEPHRDFFRLPHGEELLPDNKLVTASYDIEDDRADDWLLLGAFPLNDREVNRLCGVSPDTTQSFAVDWPKDSHWTKDVAADHPQTRPAWKRWKTTGGFVDFGHMFRPRSLGVAPGSNAVATGFTVVDSPTPQTAKLTLSFDDKAFIRINGGSPIELGDVRYFDSRTVDVPLKQGDNLVQVVLTNTFGRSWGAWAYALHLKDAAGNPLKVSAATLR
jgi:hypothetical protein